MLKKVAKKKVKVKKKVKKVSQTKVAKVKKKVKVKTKTKTKAKAPVKVKKKRGRPRKVKVEELSKVPKSPKKRGRPVGQKNKTYKPHTISSTECGGDDYVPPKTYQFLGYCPKEGCNTMVGSMDLAAKTKTIFVCSMCGKRAKVETLKDEIILERPADKIKKAEVW